MLLSHLFEGARIINSAIEGTEKLTANDIESLQVLYNSFIYNILGLKDESADRKNEELTGKLVDMIISIRQEAKNRKDWETSDRIRKQLGDAGIVLRDRKDGADWERE